jgi:hypothetical protein
MSNVSCDSGVYRRTLGKTVNADQLVHMLELAIQTDRLGKTDDQTDPEEEKRVAIAKLGRKLDAARETYLDGDMPRDEYLRRKEQHEREIAHWESRTSETEQTAFEFALCAEALDKLARLWKSATNEDRHGTHIV